jgi:hypothetical protein
MHRYYSTGVSDSDVSSIYIPLTAEPTPPAQTQVEAHGRPIEPEFLEIATPPHLPSETTSNGGV